MMGLGEIAAASQAIGRVAAGGGVRIIVGGQWACALARYHTTLALTCGTGLHR